LNGINEGFGLAWPGLRLENPHHYLYCRFAVVIGRVDAARLNNKSVNFRVPRRTLARMWGLIAVDNELGFVVSHGIPSLLRAPLV
jgi:hypothetical protein